MTQVSRRLPFCVACALVAIFLTALPGRLAPPALAAACPPGAISVTTTVDTVAANAAASSLDAGGQVSLRSAVMFANAGTGPHTICLSAGTYTLTLGPGDPDSVVPETGDLDVFSNDLTVLGAGAASTIIRAGTVPSTNGTDGNGIDRIFDINDFALNPMLVAPLNVTLTDLTLQNGRAASSITTGQGGGAIAYVGDLVDPSEGTLTLTNVVLQNNFSDGFGGALAMSGGALVANNVSVLNNFSDVGGGFLVEGDLPSSIGTSIFSGNTAEPLVVGFSEVGGLLAAIPLTLTNSTIINNSAVDHLPGGPSLCSPGNCGFGGGLLAVGALTMSGGSVSGNKAYGEGGGAAVQGTSNGGALLDGVTIANNAAGLSGVGDSGGLDLASGFIHLGTTSPVTITGNSAVNGGGINIEIIDGSEEVGVTMDGGVIANNSARVNGGGLQTSAFTSSTAHIGAVTTTSLNPFTAFEAAARLLPASMAAGRAHSPAKSLPAFTTSVSLFGMQLTGNRADSDNDGMGDGGAIYHDGGPISLEPLSVIYSRFFGNTGHLGSGIFQVNGTATASEDWWGCNTGPNTPGCTTTHGAVSAPVWLKETLTAGTATIGALGTTATDSFLIDSNGAAVSPADLIAMMGVPVIWSATGSPIKAAQNTVQPSGTATAQVGGPCGVGGSVAIGATVDNATVSLALPQVVTTGNSGCGGTGNQVPQTLPGNQLPSQPAGVNASSSVQTLPSGSGGNSASSAASLHQ